MWRCRLFNLLCTSFPSHFPSLHSSTCVSVSLSLSLCALPLLFHLSLPPTPHQKVTAEELSGNDDYVELSFSARKLDDKVCMIICAPSRRFQTPVSPWNMGVGGGSVVWKVCGWGGCGIWRAANYTQCIEVQSDRPAEIGGCPPSK